MVDGTPVQCVTNTFLKGGAFRADYVNQLLSLGTWNDIYKVDITSIT